METIIFALIGLAIGICVLVIVLVKRNKRKNKENALMPTLNTWISKAKTLGYNYTQMRTLLEINEWDKKIVKKALKNNGVEMPEGYVE